MSYCIKLGEWGAVFAVPSSVVDKHLKLAGSAQLKVLLWILRNSGREFSDEGIAESLSLDREDVKDSLEYWADAGILRCCAGVITAGDERANTLNNDMPKGVSSGINNTAKNRPRALSRTLKPGSSYVAERTKSSKDVAFLLQEAEVILGRLISPGDSAVLITLMDNEGLPIDVILMIIQYAVSVGKGNMRYIETVGISWASEGIDTIESAEKKIKSLGQFWKSWAAFENIIGMQRRPTGKEEECINRWYNLWGYEEDMIKEAYEICVNSNGKYILKYMDSIISRWHSGKIYTLEQVRLQQQKKAKLKSTDKSKKPTYDIEKYKKNYNIFDEIRFGSRKRP